MYKKKYLNMNKTALKKKMEYGDYNTLAKMLDIPQSTARSRFLRDNAEALYAMEQLIENREQFIEEFRNKQNQ